MKYISPQILLDDVLHQHHFIGIRVFLEYHKRLLVGKFGKIPRPIQEDAFSMGGYCIDAPSIMPAGSCVYLSVDRTLGGPAQTTIVRE